MADGLETLYNKLKTNPDIELSDFNTFKNNYGSEQGIKNLHSKLSNVESIELSDFNTFKKNYYSGPSSTPSNVTTPKQEPPVSQTPAPKQKSNVEAPKFVAPTNVAPVNPKTIKPSTAAPYEKRKLLQDETELQNNFQKQADKVKKDLDYKLRNLSSSILQDAASSKPLNVTFNLGDQTISVKNPQLSVGSLYNEATKKLNTIKVKADKQAGKGIYDENQKREILDANNYSQKKYNDELLKLQDDRKYYTGLLSNPKDMFTAPPQVTSYGSQQPSITYATIKPEILEFLGIQSTGNNNRDYELVQQTISKKVSEIDANVSDTKRKIGISKTDSKNINNGVDYAKNLSTKNTSDLLYSMSGYNKEIGKLEKKAQKQVGDITSMDIATAEKQTKDKGFFDFLTTSFISGPITGLLEAELSTIFNWKKEDFTKKLSYKNLGAEKSQLSAIDAAAKTGATIIDNRLQKNYDELASQFRMPANQIKELALSVAKVSDQIKPGQRLTAPEGVDPTAFNGLIENPKFTNIVNTFLQASDIYDVDGQKQRISLAETNRIMQQKAKEFGTIAKFQKDIEKEQAFVDVLNKKSKDAKLFSKEVFDKLAYETAYSLTYGKASTKEMIGGVAKVGETLLEDITKSDVSNITKQNIDELIYSTDLYDALVPTNSAVKLSLFNPNKFIPIKDMSGNNVALEVDSDGDIVNIHAENYSYVVRDPKQVDAIKKYYNENKDDLGKIATSLSKTEGGKRAIFDNTVRNVGKEMIQEVPTMLFEIGSGGALAPIVAGSNRLRKISQYGIAATSNMIETYPMVYKGYEENIDDPNNPYAAMLTTGGLGLVSLWTSGLDRKLIGLGERAVSKEVLPEIIENSAPIIKAISAQTAKIADKTVRENTFKAAVNKVLSREVLNAFKPAFRKAMTTAGEIGGQTVGEVAEETISEPLTRFAGNFLNAAILDNQAYKLQTLDDLGFLDPETAWLTFWTAGAISSGANLVESLQKNNPYTQVDYLKAALKNPDKIEKMLTNIEEDNSPEVIQKIREDYQALKTSYDTKKKELNISQDLLETLDFKNPAVQIILGQAGIGQDVVENIKGSKNYDALIIQQVLEEKKSKDLEAQIQEGVSQGLIVQTEDGYKAVSENPLSKPFEKTIADFEKTRTNIQYFDKFVKDFNTKTAPIQRQFVDELQKSLVVAPDLYDVKNQNEDGSSIYYNVNAFNTLRAATLSKLVNQARLAEIETEMIGSQNKEQLQEEKAKVTEALNEATETVNRIQKQYKPGRTETNEEFNKLAETASLSQSALVTALDDVQRKTDVETDLDNHEINDKYDEYVKSMNEMEKVANKLRNEYGVEIPKANIVTPEQFKQIKENIKRRQDLGKKLNTNQGTLTDLKEFVGEVDETSKIEPETAEDIDDILNDENQVLIYANELNLPENLPYSKVKEEVSTTLHSRLRETAANNAEKALGINEILVTEIPQKSGQNITYIIDGEEFTVANRPNSNVVTITDEQKAQVVIDELGREVARRIFSETMSLSAETLNAIKNKVLLESYPELDLEVDDATMELIAANIINLKLQFEAQGIEVLFNDKVISSKFTTIPESENSIVGIASKIPLIAVTPEGETHLVSFKLFTGSTSENLSVFDDEMTVLKSLFTDNKVNIDGIHTLPIKVKANIKDGVVKVEKNTLDFREVANPISPSLIELKTNIALENDILNTIEVKPVVEDEEITDVEVGNEYVQVNRGEYSNGIETKYIVPTSNSDLDPYIEISKEVYDEWKKIDDKEQEEKQTLETQLKSQEERYRSEKEEESISRNINQYLAAVNQTKAKLKANALKYAAEKRQVLGTLTDVEKSKIKERDNKLILGDEGNIDGVQYKVIGFPFGKIKLSAIKNGAESVVNVDRESDIAKKLLNIKKSEVDNIETRKGTLIADLNQYLSNLSKKQPTPVKPVIEEETAKALEEKKADIERRRKDIISRKSTPEEKFEFLENIPEGTIFINEDEDALIVRKKISKRGTESYVLIPLFLNEDGKWVENPRGVAITEKKANGEFNINASLPSIFTTNVRIILPSEAKYDAELATLEQPTPITPVEPVVEPQTPEFEGTETTSEPVEPVSQTPVYNVGGTSNGVYITVEEKTLANKAKRYKIKIDNNPDLNDYYKDKVFKTLSEVQEEYAKDDVYVVNGREVIKQPWFVPKDIVTNTIYSLQDAEGNSLKSPLQTNLTDKINDLSFVTSGIGAEVSIVELEDVNDTDEVQSNFTENARLVVRLGEENIAEIPFGSPIRKKLQTVQVDGKTRLAPTTANINKVVQRDFDRTPPVLLSEWLVDFSNNNGPFSYDLGYVQFERDRYVLKNADNKTIYTYPANSEPVLGATYLIVTDENKKDTRFALQTPKLKDVDLNDGSKITKSDVITLLGLIPTQTFKEKGKELYQKIINGLEQAVANSNSRTKEIANLIAKDLGAEFTPGRAESTTQQLAGLNNIPTYTEETKDKIFDIIADFFLDRIITLTPESASKHLITTNPKKVFLDNTIQINNLVSGDYSEKETPRFQVATPQETPQDVVREMVDTLEGTGLANRVFEMTAEEMDAKLQEIGFSEEVKKQIIGERGAEALDKLEEATIRLDNLKVAREMETAGKDAKTIRLATGWEKGADGKWRYEIEKTAINYNILPILKASSDGFYYVSASNDYVLDNQSGSKGVKVSESFVTYPLEQVIGVNSKLMKLYPQLSNIKVVYTNKLFNNNARGEWDLNTNTIRINTDYIVSKEEVESVLVHEIQHAIQDIEGFAKGGSPSQFSAGDIKTKIYNKLEKDRLNILNSDKSDLEKQIREEAIRKKQQLVIKQDAEFLKSEEYRKLAGEVEARNVQKRMNMSAEERRNTLLSETEDVARADQNILLNYTQSAKYIELPFVYRGINSNFSVDYNGVQYFAVNEKYAKAFGKNIIKAKILESKVLDLTKWNKWLKEKGVEDTLFDQDLLNIHESWFDKNKNFTDKNNTSILGLIDISLNEEDSKYFFDNFEKEFNEADVIYGEDMGNKGEFVYAVKNPNAISVEETPLFQIKEKGVTLTPTGFTYKGDVYLNMSNMRMDTPIHEFSHLLLDWMKVNKPELYQEGLKKVKAELAKSEGGKTTMYRGVGNNYASGINTAFTWVAVDSDTASNYGQVTEVKVNLPKNAFKFPYKSNIDVRGNDIGNLVRNVIYDRVKSKTISADIASNIMDDIEEYVKLAGDKLEKYHTKVSKPEASNKLKTILEKLGYDGIFIEEGEGTYAIFKSDIQDIIDFVKTTQPNLTGEAFENEILAEVSGRKGVDLLTSAQKSGIIDWLKKFWAEVKNMLGLLDASIEQVANMTLEEYANAMAVQLLKGEDITSNIPQAIERNNGNPLTQAPNGKPSILYQSYKDLGYSDSEVERLVAQVYSDEFGNWFGRWWETTEDVSKVVDENGMPKLMFHETDADWFIYDKTKIKAGKLDSVTPNGIFLKSSDKNIGLGDKQMNLFSSVKNPIYAKDREELETFFISNIKEYAEIKEKMVQVEIEATKIVKEEDDALNRERDNFTGKIPSEEWSKIRDKIVEKYDKLSKPLEVEYENLSLEAKPFIDSFMKDSKYDGIFLTSDVGSFGRETDATIAMEPKQIKSATLNIGTFSTETPDIRFQMATEEETTQIPDCV